MPAGIIGPRGRITTVLVTSYTLSDADNHNTLCFNNAGTVTVRLPTALQIGWTADIVQQGPGVVNIVAASGVTLNNLTGASGLAAQWAAGTLTAIDQNVYQFTLIANPGILTLPVSGADGGTGVSNPGALATLPTGAHTLAGLDVQQTWTAVQLFDDGIGISGAMAPLGASAIYIGTLTTPTPDPTIVWGRAIDRPALASHGITDCSTFTGGGYNSYDARPTVTSITLHYAGFQSRPDFDNPAAVAAGIMFSAAPQLLGAGNVDFMYNFYAQTPGISGAGKVDRWYGIFAEEVTTQANLAWGVYVQNQSYFGGLVGIGIIQPSARLHFAGAQTDVPTFTDDSTLTISTSLNIMNFTPPGITLTAATGNAQYLLVRPVFIPTQNTAHNLFAINNGLTVGTATANAFNLTGDVAAQTTQITFGAGYTGTLSKVFGHRILDLGAGSRVITTQTGLNIHALTAATNNTLILLGGNNPPAGNWGIYNASTYDNAFLGNIGVGGVPTGQLDLQGDMSAAAWGTNGIGIKARSATLTDTTSAGTVAEVAVHRFGPPTLAASSATTYTAAATLMVGAPVASTNVTITHGFAIHSQSDIRVDGSISVGGQTGSFPMLKNSGAELQVRVASDIADAAFKALQITTSAAAFLHITSAALANGAAAQVATMTNGPTAGNPTKWIAISDNGTTRYIPAW